MNQHVDPLGVSPSIQTWMRRRTTQDAVGKSRQTQAPNTVLHGPDLISVIAESRRLLADRCVPDPPLTEGPWDRGAGSGGWAPFHNSQGEATVSLPLTIVSVDELPKDVTSFVAEAYLCVLGREPDPAGAQDYLRAIKDGISRSQALRSMADSDEARSRGNRVVIVDDPTVAVTIRELMSDVIELRARLQGQDSIRSDHGLR